MSRDGQPTAHIDDQRNYGGERAHRSHLRDGVCCTELRVLPFQENVASYLDAGQKDQQDTEWLQILCGGLSQSPLQSTGRIFQGSLNRNIQLADPKGRSYLLRIPHQKRRSIYEHLATTYREEGFTSLESFHRYRTIAEQARFMQQAAREGIRVLPAVAIAHDASSLLVPFLQAQPLDVYLLQGEMEAVGAILANLTQAHQKGLILGDRWGSNTLITAEGIVEVDFDIALEGPTAKEFELGKLFYHLLFYASNRQQMLAYLQGYLSTNRATFSRRYNLATVQFFISKHAEVFGVRKTVVIDPENERNILPVSGEQADQLIGILQSVQVG